MMLAWGAWRHSPTWDEPGHLAAGICHWQYGRFEWYQVNPPLVRMIAALPVLLAGAETPWDNPAPSPATRTEFGLGRRLLLANGERSLWLLTLARWACIPLALLGGYVCFRWAADLYGPRAGLMAATVWCFDPNILAHAQLITPDAGAAALGVTAAYVFWRRLQNPCWSMALAAGIALGLAELTKFTWLVLFPLWPVVWAFHRWSRRSHASRPSLGIEAAQVGLILSLGLCVINAGYGFEGTFTPLGQYGFISRLLSGEATRPGPPATLGNRFAGTWLGDVPVALPENYVLGLDYFKFELEQKKWSYLRGEWRPGGWWYYYVYALAVKEPLGSWLLVLLAGLACGFRRGDACPWRDEVTLLAPAAAVLILVSSQTGFNHHLRYVLLVLPFVFIWTARLARSAAVRGGPIGRLAAAALVWSVGSSLWVWPHSLSYFNESVGGPVGGHAHLLDSNVDWDQDLLYLKRWLEAHPEAHPLGLAHETYCFDPAIAGIQFTESPRGPDCLPSRVAGLPDQVGPLPGWFAVSVNRLRDVSKCYAYFLRFEPVASAGYSILIYHISADQADRVRDELGLPPLP